MADKRQSARTQRRLHLQLALRMAAESVPKRPRLGGSSEGESESPSGSVADTDSEDGNITTHNDSQEEAGVTDSVDHDSFGIGSEGEKGGRNGETSLESNGDRDEKRSASSELRLSDDKEASCVILSHSTDFEAD